MLDDPPARLIEDEVRKARGAGQTSAFAEKVTEKAAEKAAEKAMEQSGGNAKVDIDSASGTVKVEGTDEKGNSYAMTTGADGDGSMNLTSSDGSTVQTGENVKIPDERSGLLMVFRTYDKLSYGLVLQASRQLAVMDKVRNP